MAEAGIASRRKCEEFITAGRVCINGKKATIGDTVDPSLDVVTFDAKPIELQQQKVVILFNKPSGVMCTSHDPQGRSTFMDFFKDIPLRLFTIGRLDYDTEGALLITNDGELANALTHPRYEVEKEYLVVCDGTLSEDERSRLEMGVELEDGLTAPTRVTIRETQKNFTVFTIVIHEGRNRQVRRMVNAVGHDVRLLKRQRIDAITLTNLNVGEWRYLTDDEIKKLQTIRKVVL
jgi:pseudouridine synthase